MLNIKLLKYTLQIRHSLKIILIELLFTYISIIITLFAGNQQFIDIQFNSKCDYYYQTTI